MSYRLKPPTHLLIVSLLLAAGSLVAQPAKPEARPSKEVVKYLDRVQLIIKKNALVADSIDWKQLSNQVKVKAQGLTTIHECKPILDHILSALRRAGDKHSFFILNEKAASQTASSYAGPQATSRYLDNGIGYIKIPAFSSMNPSVGQAFSQSTRSQLEALEAQHTITGWVVDLRHNTGGNMRPMIEGLQALLGEQTYGYFFFPRSRFRQEMPLQIGRGKDKGQPADKVQETQKKVAVLIDSLTASSGEMTAIALRGLSNSRFFGQPSGGYTTTNQPFTLSDGSYLLLATGYMADKNRTKYMQGIIPDVVVEPASNTAPDKTIETARRWLLETE